jgi:hypothetical protein
MDAILAKAVTPTTDDSSNGQGPLQLPKDGSSQFDKVKAQLQATANIVNSITPNQSSAVAPTSPSSSVQPTSGVAATAPASTPPVQAPSTAVSAVDSGVKPAMGPTRPQSIQSIPPGPEKVQQTVAVGRYHLDRIQSTVKAGSSNGTADKVKDKLTSIEKQYNQLDASLQQISPNASPQDWLRLQLMANSMNENISVLSKLVDAAASGTKTILQTQI